MTGRVTDQGLRDWLGHLATTHSLIAPVDAGGRTLFRTVRGPDEIDFGYGQSTVPPKEWFFPRIDPLFEFEPSLGAIDLPVVRGPRVIFGIRPCDANALAVLDHLFLAAPVDTLWETRRNETVLIGLACTKAQTPECLCTSLGGGPQDATNLDILLVETNDGYTVQAVTRRGRALLEGVDLQAGPKVRSQPVLQQEVPAAAVRDRIMQLFDSEYWDHVSDRCLGCRMCSFLCPTCHCFDVRDYAVEGKIERDRCWDGCQSSHFTKLAGGHNPRGNKSARLRQFYAHKYVYYPERFGVTACVGCGRCAHYCPVNIDIRETLRDLQRLEV